MGFPQLRFIDYTTEIEAPAEEVFSFFKKIEKWPTWAKGIRRAERKAGGDWGVGFELAFVPDFLPLPLRTRVLTFEEGRLIEWGIRSPLATIVHRFEFHPVDEKRCRVRHTEHAEGLLALVGILLKGPIERFDRGLADDLKAAFAGKG